jgi:hypothetical protein
MIWLNIIIIIVGTKRERNIDVEVFSEDPSTTGVHLYRSGMDVQGKRIHVRGIRFTVGRVLRRNLYAELEENTISKDKCTRMP